MAVLEPYKGDYYLWKYLPSLPGSIAFILLFLIVVTLQGMKLYKTRAWFCTYFLVGCIRKSILLNSMANLTAIGAISRIHHPLHSLQ